MASNTNNQGRKEKRCYYCLNKPKENIAQKLEFPGSGRKIIPELCACDHAD
jgi:hypothetical protein